MPLVCELYRRYEGRLSPPATQRRSTRRRKAWSEAPAPGDAASVLRRVGWAVSHLIESAVAFSDSCCAKGSATYSVLVRFHAAICMAAALHGMPSHAASAIRQQRRLCKGQDLHRKLSRLLQCPPITSPAFRPDMATEQRVLTFEAFLLRPPQSSHDWAKGVSTDEPGGQSIHDCAQEGPPVLVAGGALLTRGSGRHTVCRVYAMRPVSSACARLNRRRMAAAAHRPRVASAGPAARGRRAPRPKAVPSQLELAEPNRWQLKSWGSVMGS